MNSMTCNRCKIKPSIFICNKCQSALCTQCDEFVHSSLKRSHEREKISSPQKKSSYLSQRTNYETNLNFHSNPLINENININENEINEINNLNYNNEINSRNQINNNISNRSPDKLFYTYNNFIKNNNEENKNINNNKYNNNEKSSVNENDSNESEIPLITLNFLSICQCCKNQFNSQNNVPYLFKCGHFFCKQCINEQFTDEEGIKCPNDGLIAKYLSELKILNNFINDKNAEKNIKIKYKEIYCEYHKGQKLSHYIENSKELICVYCAFERFKSNPGVEIKDINEKCKSMENKIDNIIDDNQHNVEIIQSA